MNSFLQHLEMAVYKHTFPRSSVQYQIAAKVRPTFMHSVSSAPASTCVSCRGGISCDQSNPHDWMRFEDHRVMRESQVDAQPSTPLPVSRMEWYSRNIANQLNSVQRPINWMIWDVRDELIQIMAQLSCNTTAERRTFNATMQQLKESQSEALYAIQNNRARNAARTKYPGLKSLAEDKIALGTRAPPSRVAYGQKRST